MTLQAPLPPSCRPFVWSDLEWLSAAWRPLIEKYALAHSNYSAINALLFREKHGFYLFEHDPPFLIEPLPDRVRMTPTCFPLQWDSTFFQTWFGKPCTLYPVADAWIKHFPSTEYTITYSDAESDYLFKTDVLRLLKGRHLSSRRNLLYQLLREHRVTVQPLTITNVKDAKSILEQWQAHYTKQHSTTPSAITPSDYLPCHEALEKFSTLPLTGLLAYAEETPVGFYLGERLSKSVYLLHFLKEVPTYHGVVPFLCQACAASQEAAVEWMNLEPDLGIPGLRQAKHAYHPDHLLLKWEIKKR